MPFSGIAFEAFDGILTHTEFVSGVKHGVETQFCPSGALKSSCEYHLNVPRGMLIGYSADGNKESEAKYEYGLCF